MLANRIAIIRHGRVIANGTINELAQQFVGKPIMELRVNGEMVSIENYGIDWLQYRTAEPQVTNPQLLSKCIEMGVEVVTLSQVTKTLEDIYLQVVEEDEKDMQKEQSV